MLDVRWDTVSKLLKEGNMLAEDTGEQNAVVVEQLAYIIWCWQNVFHAEAKQFTIPRLPLCLFINRWECSILHSVDMKVIQHVRLLVDSHIPWFYLGA